MIEKKAKLKELVTLFHTNIKEYKSSSYDEANTKTDFIDKFFELLDWDVRNMQGFSEDYREVVREDKIHIQGKPAAPDYSFKIGKERKFFVDQMLSTQKLLHSAQNEADKKLYQQKADLIDKQIDTLVYKLYDLTEEEIKIVEGNEK